MNSHLSLELHSRCFINKSSHWIVWLFWDCFFICVLCTALKACPTCAACNSESIVIICSLDCYAEPNQHQPGEPRHCDNTHCHPTVHHRTWRGGEPNRSGIFRKFIQGNRYWDACRTAVRMLNISRYHQFEEGLLDNEGKNNICSRGPYPSEVDESEERQSYSEWQHRSTAAVQH